MWLITPKGYHTGDTYAWLVSPLWQTTPSVVTLVKSRNKAKLSIEPREQLTTSAAKLNDSLGQTAFESPCGLCSVIYEVISVFTRKIRNNSVPLLYETIPFPQTEKTFNATFCFNFYRNTKFLSCHVIFWVRVYHKGTVISKDRCFNMSTHCQSQVKNIVSVQSNKTGSW